MAQQRSHLTHRCQARRGLQTFLAGARQLFHTSLLAHIKHRTHPTRLLARGVDQRRLEYQHGKALTVFAHKDRLHPFARRGVTGQTQGLSLAIFVDHLWRPVRRRNAVSQQLFGREAHHLTKSGVDVGDASLAIARAQTRDQRVFHRFTKSQGIGQIRLDALASAHISCQQTHHACQRNRHHGHQCGENVGKHIRRCAPTIESQHHGVARQGEQLFRSKYTRAALCCAVHGQSGAIGFGERDFLAAQQLRV